MALIRWEWVDYLNIELYEHNLDRRDAQEQPETQTYYDSDEDIFFDRLNHHNLVRFMDEMEFIRYELAAQRRYHLQLQQQYYTNFRILYQPPAYTPIIKW